MHAYNSLVCSERSNIYQMQNFVPFYVYCVLIVSVLTGSIIVCGDGENGDKFVEDIMTRYSCLLTANKVNGAFLNPMTRSEKSEVSYKIDCFLLLKIVGRFAVISAIFQCSATNYLLFRRLVGKLKYFS